MANAAGQKSSPKHSLNLPDLEQARSAVLNSLARLCNVRAVSLEEARGFTPQLFQLPAIQELIVISHSFGPGDPAASLPCRAACRNGAARPRPPAALQSSISICDASSVCCLLSLPWGVAQKRPFDVNALMELKRISDPQISPDGRWVTFTVQSVDVAANKKPTADLDRADRRRVAAADHARGRGQPARALVARFEAHRVHFGPRRIVADLDDGPGRRRCQAGHQSLDRSRRRDCFRPTARTFCSPARSIRIAAPTTPATRRASTRSNRARSRRGSTRSCSTGTGAPGRASGAATCW